MNLERRTYPLDLKDRRNSS